MPEKPITKLPEAKFNEKGECISPGFTEDGRVWGTTSSFIGLMNEKKHTVKIQIPAVKFLGLTIRPAYTHYEFIPCEKGTSSRDDLVASANKPNSLLKTLRIKDA